MPTPNYEFEKRKRDLAKKAAKAAKKQKKLEKGTSGPQIIDPNAPEGEAGTEAETDSETGTEGAETESKDTPPAAEG